MKHLLLVLTIFTFNGCDFSEIMAENEFIDDADKTSIYFEGHKRLCDNNTDDIFCTEHVSIGDIQPTWNEAMNVVSTLSSNFDYTSEPIDNWTYNLTVDQKLNDDCDGVMLTLAYYFITEMGIDQKHIVLASTYQGNDEYHVFLAVNTSDRGWTHFDYGNSGQPLEANINWHNKFPIYVNDWVKGNIQ